MQKLNKGEWSEPYCLLKVIADKQLFLCNASLERTGDILKVLGGDLSETTSYTLTHDTVTFHFQAGETIFNISTIDKMSENILSVLRSKQEKTFPLDDVSNFFAQIGNPPLKSKSSHKSDSRITVFDPLTQDAEGFAFSIKSFLAGSPTLINAGKTTNFTYVVSGLKDKSALKNLKAKKLLKQLAEENASVIFESMDSPTYHRNLTLIDTQMPKIISEMLKIYYSSKIRSIPHIVEMLQIQNPLSIGDASLYKNKITDFLFYSATGMFPNTAWEGIQSIDGGCLIVKETGDISAFYIFRPKFLSYFREYLFQKSFLDTASTTRHGFGSLYEDDGHMMLKLNLQVRISK